MLIRKGHNATLTLILVRCALIGSWPRVRVMVRRRLHVRVMVRVRGLGRLGYDWG